MFDFGSHNFDFKSFDLKRKISSILFYVFLKISFYVCVQTIWKKLDQIFKNNYVIICLLILYGLFNTACRSQLRDVCA